MPKPIVDNSALIRLIEIELVNQYKRFLSKRVAVAPRNCIFNAWEKTAEGAYVRTCKLPERHTLPNLESPSGSQCYTLSKAKKCPMYLHYTGGKPFQVVSRLTVEFIEKLVDPEKRATSFKALHTLWILLHEIEVPNISWLTRIKLRFIAKSMSTRYHKHLLRHTPKAEQTWTLLLKNFQSALNPIKE